MDYRNQVQASTLGTVAAQDSEIENSRIRDGISRVEQALSELGGAVGALERRIETALTPVPPQGADVNKAAPTPVASHIMVRLDILNDGFNDVIQHLHNIRQRVEL